MKLLVNGKPVFVDNLPSLQELVEHLGYDTEYVAVALNMECVPKRQLPSTKVQENDEVEVLSPQQGG